MENYKIAIEGLTYANLIRSRQVIKLQMTAFKTGPRVMQKALTETTNIKLTIIDKELDRRSKLN